jgi:DNA-binding beta-propeller fold protein YncE
MRTLRLSCRVSVSLALLFALGCQTSTGGQSAGGRRSIMLSGNETKMDLTSGSSKVVPAAEPDSVSVLDFATIPPRITTVPGIANTVMGPPSNIAISPDGTLALIANSIRLDPSAGSGWVPEAYVHVLDLTTDPPSLLGRAQTDPQPSGISFTPNGRLALVANRAGGTVTVLAIEGKTVRTVDSIKLGEPGDEVSDVAVSPDGKMALASVRLKSHLAVLKIENDKVTATGRKISAYGQVYRVVITPDGQLALTAGNGYGNALDADALTVIDLQSSPPRTIDYVPLGVAPESIEISPDGRLLAAVVMDGSNVAPDSPYLSKEAGLVILERRGRTFVKTQRLPIGRIPEGVAFTGDGRYLVVQCHPERQLWVFEVKNGKVTDTGTRISMPGMPSSLRAARVK